MTDDNALDFVYRNYAKSFFAGSPVFFSGVNDLNMHDVMPKNRFAGVYEIKEIKQNIELIKQFSPQTRDIYIIGDDSNTYDAVKKSIEPEKKNFKALNFHYISSEYISNIIRNLPNNPRSFVLLTTIGNFKNNDGNTLLPQESIESIKKNKNIILLTMEDAYMYKGVVGGYVTSGKKQGSEAAKLVLKYLSADSMSNITSLTKSPNIYMFNAKELVASRIILSEYIARNAVIIGKDVDIIEKNKTMLLNILAMLLSVIILAAIIYYALQRRKYSQELKNSVQLKKLRSKMNFKDQFINNLLSFSKTAYWRLDVKTNELFISQEFLDILKIDSHVYQDDLDIFEQFIHVDDKDLFEKNLSNVKIKGASSMFEHRMTTPQREILSVEHTIYPFYEKSSLSVIVGMVRVEE